MIFTQTYIHGLYIIEPELKKDLRGWFARGFCAREFSERNLHTDYVQCNMALNNKKGTLRGMHFQNPPHWEVKLVKCDKGSFFDVAIDLRENSPTYKKWFGIELSEVNKKMLYIPQGFAHGYLTLTNNTEVFYMVSEFYTPGSESGIRYNDPSFKILWPQPIRVMSEKDANWEDFRK